MVKTCLVKEIKQSIILCSICNTVFWQMLFAPRCKAPTELYAPVWNSFCSYLHPGVLNITANTLVIVANNAICTRGQKANVAIYTPG